MSMQNVGHENERMYERKLSALQAIRSVTDKRKHVAPRAEYGNASVAAPCLDRLPRNSVKGRSARTMRQCAGT